MTVGAGKLGVTDGSAFSTTGVREGKTGEQVVGQAHGKYYEAASRGNLYYARNASSRIPTTTLSTTCPFTLYNPLGSKAQLSIKRVSFAQGITGTLGTGGLFHTAYTLSGPLATQGGTVPTGTAVTIFNALVGLPSASVATVLEAVSLHTTVPVALWPWLNMSEVAATTIGGNTINNFEDVDGAIVLGPGSGWAPQSIMAAGSSPLAWFGVCWEEIPIT